MKQETRIENDLNNCKTSKIAFRILIFFAVILFACNNHEKKKIIVENDSLVNHKSCISSFNIIRGSAAGLDGMSIELSIYDSVFTLIDERKIINYKPIHNLLSSFPSGFYPTPRLQFDKEKHTFSIRQGTNVFFKYKTSELDSIQNLIMKDLIIILIDKNQKEWKLYSCR